MLRAALYTALALGLAMPALADQEPPKPLQAPELCGVPYDPSWSGQLYVLTDSVVLGAKSALKKGFSGWKVTVEGQVSAGLRESLRALKKETSLPPVVVVALGYNTSWEPERKNYDLWAEQFDKQAESILKAAQDRGAKKIVWVLLREPSASGKKGAKHYERHGFYFAYVNERLRALHDRHPEIALADWPSASLDPSLTADGIHLNAAGAAAMVEVIKAAIGL